MSFLNVQWEAENLPSEMRQMFTYDAMSGQITRTYAVGGRLSTVGVGHIRKVDGYLIIGIRNRLVLGHRLAWCLHYGEWPAAFIDHKNGVKTDNRICNLRVCNKRENAANAKLRKDSDSGFKGIRKSKSGKRWAVYVRQGDKYYVGSFDTLEQARQVHAEISKQVYGEFARAA